MNPSWIYWLKEFCVIFSADIAAALFAFFAWERLNERRGLRGRELRTTNTLKNIIGYIDIRVSALRKSLQLENGSTFAINIPFYGLDSLLHDSSAWDFEQSEKMRTSVQSLFVSIVEWEAARGNFALAKAMAPILTEAMEKALGAISKNLENRKLLSR